MTNLIKIRCDSCDGYGDHGVEEESGCLYACYACGMTGFLMVTAEQKARMAWEAHKAADALILEGVAEAKRRAELGVPDGWYYYFCEHSGDVVMKPLRGHAPAPVAMDLEWDEIPF